MAINSRFVGLGNLSLHPMPDGKTWRVERGFTYVSESQWRITVPHNMLTDFASIPRFFWRILPPWDTYGPAALVHDYLYSEQPCTRETADEMLAEAMRTLGVAAWKRFVIYRAVRWFGGVAWRGHKRTRMVSGIAAALCLMLLTGCIAVPRTRIVYPTKAGPVIVESPKQVSADEISVTVHPDGSVTTKITKLKSLNDADVIGTVGAANLKMLEQSITLTERLTKLAEKLDAVTTP